MFHFKTGLKIVDKKKIKSTNIYALVTQIKFYSKNFQLMPNILLLYCIKLFKRIPKRLDFLFYEFSTN